MKVYYHEGERWNWTPTLLKGESNLLALSFNNWDDYNISTTLNACLFFDKELILEFSLKILIENDTYSPRKLNKLRQSGWDGFFPIPDYNYVSVPSDIYFYDALLSKLGQDEAREILNIIRDAGYLLNVVKDESIKGLIESTEFETSPLREVGARKAFADGWKLFEDIKSSIEDFKLYTQSRDLEQNDEVSFHFNSETLPYDINVLIGPNGIGKSFTLKKMVEYWLGVKSGDKLNLLKSQHQPFDKSPNIAKLILISYSPFEDFELDLDKYNLKDKDVYKYFGFRKSTITNGKRRVGISRNLPATDSVDSILKAFSDDVSFGYMQKRAAKIDAIWSVLQPALDFEFIALELNKNAVVPDTLKRYVIDINSDRRCISLHKKNFRAINLVVENSPEIFKFTSGVLFLKDDEIIDLSSGQRLFCYIVINVVGQIKTDSLIIIDEPELFLHPTLEIEFISLLKKVLKAFNSKAILATHSLAIAREVPAKCMHVYKKLNNSIEIDHPPFETFGGDMQRISSYVFSDIRVSKPFSEWVDEKLKEVGSKKVLIELLKGEINEEIMIKILNSKV
ncbi:AAA family ATPase [Pectobacterium sp. CHL-2024]|uniref:AAA family ATPase n=1 Tax=Pectobacterium sp. CHL-2024 TaxID=3377079 RepID=UPI003808C756